MKLSIFTSTTNPEKRMDPYQEALSCYEEFADEVVTVGRDWPEEFEFDHIGKTFQEMDKFDEAAIVRICRQHPH